MKLQGMIIAGLICINPLAYAADPNKAMPGSYQGVSVADDRVVDAANFAVEKINKGKLVTIVSAHAQVVAGMNYDLVLQLRNSAGKIRSFEVKVFVPLPTSGLPMQLKSAEELQS